MKTIRYILTAILLMMVYMANAQTIQIYKDGAVVKEYSSAEVDSVVYKPAAAQPRYYYYAGWTKPSESNLASLFAGEYGHEILGDVNSFTYNYATAGNKIVNPAKDYGTVYFVIPSQLSLYDNLGTDSVADQYNETATTFGGVTYRVLASKDEFYEMNFLNIKKKK